MKIANIIVMTLAGLLLIVAAALKTHQMLTEPILSKGIWESWEFFLVTIPLEMGLGIWLVSGLFRKVGWLLGTLCYGFFIGVTLYKAVTGEISCGCFGRIEVDPWKTLFIVDVPAFLLLLIFRPVKLKFLPPPWPHAAHALAIAIPACLVIGAMVPTMAFNKPEYEVVDPNEWVTPRPVPVPCPNDIPDPVPSVSDTNQQPITPTPIVDVNQSLIIEPIVTEVNLPKWEWLEFIDVADSISSGIVVVYLYHYNCPDCIETIPTYDQYSRDFADQAEELRFAFIKLPPYGPDEEDPIPKDTPAIVGKYEDVEEPLIETPVVLLLEDGVVFAQWQVDIPNIDKLLETAMTGGN